MIMKAVDIRNETFGDIQARLEGDRLAVWQALRVAGERTTRELAADMGWDILRVRPRVTELYQLGLIQCCGKKQREGLYYAEHLETVRLNFEAKKRLVVATTGELALGV